MSNSINKPPASSQVSLGSYRTWMFSASSKPMWTSQILKKANDHKSFHAKKHYLLERLFIHKEIMIYSFSNYINLNTDKFKPHPLFKIILEFKLMFMSKAKCNNKPNGQSMFNSRFKVYNFWRSMLEFEMIQSQQTNPLQVKGLVLLWIKF